MWLGFNDAEELRARHAAFLEHRRTDRAIFARQFADAQQAINASWRTLERSKAMVEHADRFGREREIQTLVDDLIEQERRLIDMRDDGAILAAIFPRRAQNAR
jgi:hypothetical protein